MSELLKDEIHQNLLYNKTSHLFKKRVINLSTLFIYIRSNINEITDQLQKRY